MTPLEQLLAARRSTRAFLPDPVPQADVARILRAARQAPSGANLQPGRFYALAGNPLKSLSETLIAASRSGRPIVSDYSYFPQPMGADLKARQRAAGFALYQSLGIDRRDLAGRRAQFERNYAFFDAPVGLIVTIRRDMGAGCFMDLGLSLMALLLAAEALGLGACGIGALANHGDLIHAELGLEPEELVVCGVALGHPDPAAPVNQFATERDPLEVFARFSGFAD